MTNPGGIPARPTECDLVMQGGITSGVAYPAAVLELYKQFLSAQKNPIPDIEKRLKNVQENPKGSNE